MQEKGLVDNEQTLFRRVPDVEEIPWGKRIALYHGEMEKVAILNTTGSILWKRLETPQSKQALVQHLKTQFFGFPEEQFQKDVATYLQEMIEKKCVEHSVEHSNESLSAE